MTNAFTIPTTSSVTKNRRIFPKVLNPQKNLPQIVLKGSSKNPEPAMMEKPGAKTQK